MDRLFQNHRIRARQSLEGLWDFGKLRALSIDQLAENIDYNYKLSVPGCWEMHPQLLTYRGQGRYRKSIYIENSAHVRLLFKGVSHTAKVYWDGEQIAEHYNAYTAFDTVIMDVQSGVHELCVEVDNSFGQHSALHLPNDYYTYGGMIRPVIIEILPLQSCSIQWVQFTPIKEDWTTDEEGNWQANVRIALQSHADHDIKGHIQFELSPLQQSTLWKQELPEITLKAGQYLEFAHTFTFSNIQSWSCEHPYLYEWQTLWYQHQSNTIELVDDWVERVGFRTINTYEGKLLLNHQPIVLKGFNRHEDHPMVGASFPIALMVQDLELMIHTGANAVRTSHYPNDERFLDLCDEYGILVWEENHARGLSIEDMRHPQFIEQCEQVNREMVTQHYNHPSIIIWAILNECASDQEEGRVHYQRQLEQIRSLDHSRPLSFASHHRANEICFDLADIVSFNLYPGWYGDEDPGELCDLARQWADQAGGKGKPMIMSEFGADGFYGYRSPNRVKGTEERQADIIESNLKAYTERAYISGMFIWQFCDCRVTEEGIWPMMRARTQNNKGIVDGYRRPKLAYEVVTRYFK